MSSSFSSSPPSFSSTSSPADGGRTVRRQRTDRTRHQTSAEAVHASDNTPDKRLKNQSSSSSSSSTNAAAQLPPKPPGGGGGGGRGSLSESELLFLEEGIACGVREDGRSCIDIRPSDVYIHVLPKSAASSLVTSTENVVLCGVSVQLARPSTGNEGEIHLTVDWGRPVRVSAARGAGACSSAGVGVGEAGYGGALTKKESVGLGEGGGGENSSIQSLLAEMMFSPQALDRTLLCVTPGKAVWRVFVDCMILKAGGGLLDAVSLAIYTALRNTYLPCVFVEDEEEGEEEEEGGGEIKVTCDERETAGSRFPAEDIPLVITVGQIGNQYVWDMSSHEETASASRILLSIHRSSKEKNTSLPRCTGIQKLGVSLLDLASLPTVIVNSQRVCKEIFDRVERQLEKQKNQKKRQQLRTFTKVIEQI